MRIKVWYYIIDCEDGSFYPEFYSTEEEALAAEKAGLEAGRLVPCEAVGSTDLIVEDYEVVL